MKITVLADTHLGEAKGALPQALLESARSSDMVIHAGDLVHTSVLAELKKACPAVKAVWGNMDPYEVRRELPEKEIIAIGKHKIGVMHGWGRPDGLFEVLKSAFNGTGVDVIVFGHSHRPTSEEKEGVLYFNPGSPTDTVFAPYASFGIIEIGDDVKTRIVKL